MVAKEAGTEALGGVGEDMPVAEGTGAEMGGRLEAEAGGVELGMEDQPAADVGVMEGAGAEAKGGRGRHVP